MPHHNAYLYDYLITQYKTDLRDPASIPLMSMSLFELKKCDHVSLDFHVVRV